MNASTRGAFGDEAFFIGIIELTFPAFAVFNQRRSRVPGDAGWCPDEKAIPILQLTYDLNQVRSNKKPGREFRPGFEMTNE
jgi:hypothetical protein